MHCKPYISISVVIVVIGLLTPANSDRNAWWKQLLSKAEARDSKQLTTAGTHLDETTAQTTNLPLKRNNWINSNNKNLESSAAQVSQNAKSWDKSYATRRSYKSSWSNDQPFRERLVETEWDDDMPVRHVIRDSWDEKENEDFKSEKEQYETPNRQWFTDYKTDNEEVVSPEKDSYNERNTNKKKQVSVNSWNIRNQLPKPERLTNSNDNWEKSSKLIDDKWSKLASNALNNQNSKDANWERLTTTTKGYTETASDDLVKPVKPKLKVMFESESLKSDKPSAKLTENKSNTNGNTSTLRSANKQFGWRSSIAHSKNVESNNERQTQTTKQKPVTTNSYAEIKTTLPPREPTITTIRSTTKAPQPVNIISETISPNKKQHRIGSWVDSEGYDDPGEGEGFDDDWIDAPIRSQPLIDDEFVNSYNDNVETPENVEEINPPRSAAQRASLEDAGDDSANWRLEDSIPGTPGNDYPTYASVPSTSFDCKTHQWPGYYADVEAQCQVFHICQMGGRKDSFLCPNGTMFNQRLFVCDWWHNVQCDETANHFGLNENIYDYNWESKRVSGTQPQSSQPSQGGSAGIRRIGNEEATFDPEITTGNVATTESTASEIDSSEPQDDVGSTDGNLRSSIKYDEEPVLLKRSSRISSPIIKFKSGKYTAQTTRRKRNH